MVEWRCFATTTRRSSSSLVHHVERPRGFMGATSQPRSQGHPRFWPDVRAEAVSRKNHKSPSTSREGASEWRDWPRPRRWLLSNESWQRTRSRQTLASGSRGRKIEKSNSRAPHALWLSSALMKICSNFHECRLCCLTECCIITGESWREKVSPASSHLFIFAHGGGSTAWRVFATFWPVPLAL